MLLKTRSESSGKSFHVSAKLYITNDEYKRNENSDTDSRAPGLQDSIVIQVELSKDECDAKRSKRSKRKRLIPLGIHMEEMKKRLAKKYSQCSEAELLGKEIKKV